MKPQRDSPDTLSADFTSGFSIERLRRSELQKESENEHENRSSGLDWAREDWARVDKDPSMQGTATSCDP